MNPLSDKQLELNQKFIDLCSEYIDSEIGESNYYFDGKGLMKFIWNKGYMLREKDYTIYD